MRNTNHFVIRNGKIVSKSEAEKLMQPPSQKLNIVKPAAVIARPLQQKIHVQTNDALTKMQIYYEDLLKKYQERIKELEKELNQKDQFIQRLGKQRLAQIDKMSAERQSRQSQVSTKEYQERMTFDTECSSQIKFSTKLPLIENKIKTKIQQQNGYKQNLIDPQNQNQQSSISTSTLHFFERENSLSSITSMSSIQSVFEQSSAGSCPSNQKNQVNTKAFFDTSTLMARLNKSASLVRNIKKFLQPSTENSPKCTDQEPTSPKANQNENKNQTNQKQQEKKTQQYHYQLELQKFIDQLIEKHSQILLLTQRLSIEKDQQIKQLKIYYQDLIKKIQFDKSYSHYKSHGSFNRSGVGKSCSKMWTQSQDKQNKKVEDKQKDKQINKEAKIKQKQSKKIKQTEHGIYKQRTPFYNNITSDENQQQEQALNSTKIVVKVQKQQQFF